MNEEEILNLQDNSIVEGAFGGDHEGLGSLYRSVHEYTACGAGMGARIQFYETVESNEPIIEWRGDEAVQIGTEKRYDSATKAEWVYCDDLYKLGTWADMQKAGQLITALSVSSIVEGVDQCTENHEIDPHEYETGGELHNAFYAALGEVEEEASQIWNDTHGCETCSKHWHGDPEDWQAEDQRWDTGNTPIWDDCPDCGGGGACI
jgi:hypothetical protein